MSMKNVKRLISIIVSVMMVTAMIPSIAFAATESVGDEATISKSDKSMDTMATNSGTCGDHLTWEVSNGTLYIHGYGDMKNYDVYSPWRNSGVRSVVFDSGITRIGGHAFYCMDGLESISIPYGVTNIGQEAFAGCWDLKYVGIPSSVTGIGYDAFSNCAFEHITLPNSLTIIGEGAFSGCDKLLDITIPDGITTIMAGTFSNCDSLRSVTIPDGVTSIGERAFAGCESLEQVEIPSGVTSIEPRTFYGCTNLPGINIPDGVTSIGEYAFEDCYNLELTIPDGVETINDGAFYYCKKFNSAIPAGVTNIGDSAFWGCDSLTEVIIPNAVTEIKEYTFFGCNNLTRVYMPEGITSIGKFAFTACGFESITIPKDVKSIGDYAFEYCDKLKSIVLPVGVKTIGVQAFKDCDNLVNVSIPASVTDIGREAFYCCKALKEVTIPGNVVRIENGTFQKCNSLNKATIKRGVKSIGESAFYECETLTTVTIPVSVTSIEMYAFCNDEHITDVYYSGTEDEWNNIDIQPHNEDLLSANIHFGHEILITEDDLFGEYNKYLKNNAYKKMLREIADEEDAIIQDRIGNSSGGFRYWDAVLASNMKAGALHSIFRGISIAAFGKDPDADEIEDELALDLVNSLYNGKTMMDTPNSIFKNTKLLTSVAGLAEKKSKLNAYDKSKLINLILANGGYDKKTVSAAVEAVNENYATIEKQLEAVGVVADVTSASLVVLSAVEANDEILNVLLENVPEDEMDSPLYKGLKRIKTRKEYVAQSVLLELIKDNAFGMVGDKVKSLGINTMSLMFGTGAQAPAVSVKLGIMWSISEFGYKMLGTALGKYVTGTVEDIQKAMFNTQNRLLIANTMVGNKRAKIAENYVNGGNKKDKLKREYAVIYSAYMQTIISGVDTAGKLADAKSKKALEAKYNKYKSVLTYDKYIESCLDTANADYNYQIVDNKAVITSRVNKNKQAAKASSKGIMSFAEDDTSLNLILDIPSEIDGYTVAGIDDSAFANDTDISYIYIPDTVTKLGANAFENCSNLNSIYMESSVTEIGDSAFKNCESLDSIEIPASVNEIGENAFEGTSDITICAAEGTAAAEYAKTNAGITFEESEPAVTEIEIVSEPAKTSYKMDEELDDTGLVIKATYEDGTSKNISDGVACYINDRKVGENEVEISYGGQTASFTATIVKSPLNYTVSYESLSGEQLAEPVKGQAEAGEELELPVPDIEGYSPVEPEQKVTIGYENNFVVLYEEQEEEGISIEDADVFYEDFCVYTGEQIVPYIFYVRLDGKYLVEGRDYEVICGDNVEVGTGGFVICGIGEYSGTLICEFEIAPIQPYLRWNSSSLTKVYGGLAFRNALTARTDGKITYKSSNTKVATVDQSGKVSIKGVGTAKITASASKGDKYAAGSTSYTLRVNPKTTTQYSPARASKAFTAKWKKSTSANASGYQVRYSTSSKMTSPKTVTVSGYGTTSKKISKLKSKKKYYIQVRVYKTVNGTKYYSAWSTKKYVTTK